MNISNGSVTFRNGTAKWGGCLAVVKDITMEGGEVVFEDCHATHAGGGAWLHNNLLQLGGHIRFHNCSAQYGGGLTVTTGSIRQLYGNMSLHSCVSHLGRGGGIYVEEQFLEQRGRLEVTNCGSLGFGDGGAVRAEAYMGYGEARFEGCFADHGGAMSLEELRHHKGNMSFVNCRAASAGGAVHTFRLRQESDLTECTSSWRRHRDRRARNRCILFKKMKSLARMSFASCSAPRGGAVNVYSLRQKGRMSFQECRAETGGAVDMTGTHFGKVSLKQLNRPVFRGGGGVDFHGCTANTGGALHSPGDVLLKRGAVYTFRDLFAAANGGAMVARTLRSAAQAQFVNVTSKTGNTIATSRDLWMDHTTFINCTGPQLSATGHLRLRNCSFVGLQETLCLAGSLRLTNVTCNSGLAGSVGPMSASCAPCDFKSVQVFGKALLDNRHAGPQCVQVPDATAEVGLNYLRLERGSMVEPANISRSFRCPFRMACVGGEVTTEKFGAMCRTGYQGRGCAQCSETHAQSDMSPLECVRCADSPTHQRFQLLHFLMPDLVVFALSASGVTSATGRQKESTVLINQFMSYVLVAGSVLQAVRSTDTFKLCLGHVEPLMEALFSVVELGEGSTGEISADCMLRALGLPSSWQARTLLTLSMPVCAVLLLMVVRGLRVAAVVGVNCFLVKFCVCFGRYLVCYRLEPEQVGGMVICEARLTPMSFTTLLGVIALVVLAAPASWCMLLQNEANSQDAFYLYLTASYREEVKMWEVTRLARKTLLALSCAAFPIMVHPLTQITCISVVLLVAFALESHFSPYKAQSWNLLEKFLLLSAMATVDVTAFFLANEGNWSATQKGQGALLFVILGMTMVPLYFQVSLILRQLLKERGMRKQAAPA
ncbi:unnamed protein product [Effrenium voratum]|nr:unnamed protein product [Effrenium voratum]